MHRLAEAVLRARTPADVTGALVHALRDGLSLGQVHLSEVSRGGEVGHATVAAPEGRPDGLIAVRTRRQLSTERLRLLELVARQTMAVFSAPPESGSPAAVQALAAAIEARDNCTHDHSEQVVSLATDVAKLLGLSPPSRTPSATARCCTTSASSRSRTRSSTSPDR